MGIYENVRILDVIGCSLLSVTPSREKPMRKLKLDVNALQVESFVAQPHAERGGTVHGEARQPERDDAGSTTCDGNALYSWLYGTCGTCIGPTYCCQPTWQATCPFTCQYSCPPAPECAGF